MQSADCPKLPLRQAGTRGDPLPAYAFVPIDRCEDLSRGITMQAIENKLHGSTYRYAYQGFTENLPRGLQFFIDFLR